MKKYELTTDTKVVFGRKLFRIKALMSFGNVKEGDIGGYIESEDNLNNDGNAWVSGNAEVSGNARVSGNAWVSGNARVSGNAWVSGNARVSGDARVYGNAEVSGNARVYGNAEVSGNARVSGNAWVSGDARVYGNAEVYGNADYTIIRGFGIEFRNTTFFRCKDDKIRVKCGCFYGDLEEFRQQVKDTRDGKIAKEYLMIADLMEYHFSEDE